jgi:hypothetical protein
VCETRNNLALEIFDQHSHETVVSLATFMGIKIKDTDLAEILDRSEQATRNQAITGFLRQDNSSLKMKAAADIIQLIEREKRHTGDSITARQAYFAGIEAKEVQKFAKSYERASILESLTSEEERGVFHKLTSYDQASHMTKTAYQACLEECTEKSSPHSQVTQIKPWETSKFSNYLSAVKHQDSLAHEIQKSYHHQVISKVAGILEISQKGLDVESHRHALRQMVQTFTSGDRTGAAHELLNWLEFDRHSDFKHTFKVLREHDLWPKDVQRALEEFQRKKRDLRQEVRSIGKQPVRVMTKSCV